VGPFVAVGGEPKSVSSPNTFRDFAPFGPGLMQFVGFEADGSILGRPTCAIKTPFPATCRAASFARWSGGGGSSGSDTTWPGGAGHVYADTWGPLRPVEFAWTTFSPGKRSLYASLIDSPGDHPRLLVHELTPEGPETVFLEQLDTPFTQIEIVETRSGHRAIVRGPALQAEGRPYSSFAELSAARITGAAGKRKIEVQGKLGIGDVWEDGRASDARDARSKKLRAGFGPIRAAAALDGSGAVTDQLLMAWVEVIPPRGYEPEPERKPRSKRGPKRSSKHQCARLDASEFWDRFRASRGMGGDGCGGRASRALSAVTVKKLLHVTRIDEQGKTTDDRSYPLAEGYNAATAHLVVAPQRGGAVVVNGVKFDAKLRPVKKASGPLPLSQGEGSFSDSSVAGEAPPARRMFAMSFDPASGEALAFLHEEAPAPAYPGPMGRGIAIPSLEGPIFAQRFSALGEPVGKAVWLSHGVLGMEAIDLSAQGDEIPAEAVAARAGDAWVVLAQGAGYHLVGGDKDGAFLPLPASCDGGCEGVLALERVSSRRGVLELFGTVDNKASFASLSLSSSSPGQPAPLALPEGARPALTVAGSVRNNDGSLAFFALRDGVPTLVAPGSTPAPAEVDGGPPPDEKGAPAITAIKPVWGDVVVLTSSSAGASATWLRAGKTVAWGEGKYAPEPWGRQPIVPGASPLLPGGKFVLPDEPGEPIALSPEVSAAVVECSFAMPTGPRRLLLGCTEPTSDQAPKVNAGVRVMRYLRAGGSERGQRGQRGQRGKNGMMSRPFRQRCLPPAPALRAAEAPRSEHDEAARGPRGGYGPLPWPSLLAAAAWVVPKTFRATRGSTRRATRPGSTPCSTSWPGPRSRCRSCRSSTRRPAGSPGSCGPTCARSTCSRATARRWSCAGTWVSPREHWGRSG
jgi:hypothetical protein